LNYYNRDISIKFTCGIVSVAKPWWRHSNRWEAHHETKTNPKVVGDNVTATPAVWNGVVYFPSYNGNLYAICAKIGDVIWQKKLTQITKSPIAILSRTT
jgi:outer membrane protein assembly factor BamB